MRRQTSDTSHSSQQILPVPVTQIYGLLVASVVAFSAWVLVLGYSLPLRLLLYFACLDVLAGLLDECFLGYLLVHSPAGCVENKIIWWSSRMKDVKNDFSSFNAHALSRDALLCIPQIGK